MRALFAAVFLRTCGCVASDPTKPEAENASNGNKGTKVIKAKRVVRSRR